MNYQEKMEEMLKSIDGTPNLLLHACCAPCSSYVLEILSQYFNITILYYNPNITSEDEYNKRLFEVKRFIEEVKYKNPVSIMEIGYNPQEFFQAVKGLENEKEGGKRCFECYKLRMKKTAEIARDNNFDYFTTTLSISPYKNVNYVNEIGCECEKIYNIKYLYADFKKKNGYKRSIELSSKYHLYRQNYCGCIYSKVVRYNLNQNDKIIHSN